MSPAQRKLSPSGAPILTASGPICGNVQHFTRSGEGTVFQLCLNPAAILLLVAPSGVSPIDPEMLTSPNNFCSAPILRSHLSSVDESVWPAMKLVPVSAMLSFADCSV